MTPARPHQPEETTADLALPIVLALARMVERRQRRALEAEPQGQNART